ncbi:unnamed protein product [Polarella glacialis]|uniref:Amine oxidase domain-containing protein n=1 Tax=Polarella glacialis TaxID=89957 RepID=A0A813J848_POLGL|nr:unnamed protein product [Polarella glacialis]
MAPPLKFSPLRGFFFLALAMSGLAASLGPHSRIVIVGGGPSGIHMASALIKRGFTNVTVLDKGDSPNETDLVYGKTHTHYEEATGDTPHEMGTCYLSNSYRNIPRLVEEYLGPDQLFVPGGDLYDGQMVAAPELDKTLDQEPMYFSDLGWLSDLYKANRYSKWFLPGYVRGAFNAGKALIRYTLLRRSIIGDTYHELPPEPTTEQLKYLNMTFAELLIKHDMAEVVDGTCIGFGSYGFAFSVPALYGLWFVTPGDLQSLITEKLIPTTRASAVRSIKNGYGSLWKAMVEKDGIDIRFNSEVVHIDRHLKDLSKPIQVVLKGGERIQADHLVSAIPLGAAWLKVFKDSTPLEELACKSVQTTGLAVQLFKTAFKDKACITSHADFAPARENGEQGLTFYLEALLPQYTPDPQKAKKVYAERESVRYFRPELEAQMTARFTVAYQYLPAYEPDAAPLINASKKFITDPQETICPTPEAGIKLQIDKNWD